MPTVGRRFVTVELQEVVFKSPVFVGDLVSFMTDTVKVGRTSITVRIFVEVERFEDKRNARIAVTEAQAVYVAVDDERRPVPLTTGSLPLTT